MATPTHSKTTLSDTDDDLDELDDVLSEFNDTRQAIEQRQTEPGSSGRPRHNTRVDARPTPKLATARQATSAGLSVSAEEDEDDFSQNFARELAKGMEDLMREIGGIDPSTSLDKTDGVDGEGELDDEQVTEAQRAFKAAWEAMLVEGMNGEAGGEHLPKLGEWLGESGLGPDANDEKAGGGGSGSTRANTTERKGNDFQERLRHAMDKMKETESNLQADSRSKGSGDTVSPKSLEELLASLQDMGKGEGGDEEDEEALTGFLEGIMGQLLSKDVLYEPLKELSDKFPGYLASPPSPLSTADKLRYERQHACVKKVLDIFDSPGYSDENAESHRVIVELMSEIQSCGSPPSELMGPLPPGVALGSDGLPQLGEGCVVA